MRTLALDYRRAPEFPFPHALEDAVSGYRFLLDSGFKPHQIAVTGDSAGAGVAVALLVRLKELGMQQPACALLLSPWADMTATADSYRRNAKRDPVLNREIMQFLAEQYLGKRPRETPLASPVFADLSGIAPLTIFVGATEALLDDAIALTRAAGLADVSARLEIWPKMFHVWPTIRCWRKAGKVSPGPEGCCAKPCKQLRAAKADAMSFLSKLFGKFRKHVLGEIDSRSDNNRGLPLSNELMRHLHFPSWVSPFHSLGVVRAGSHHAYQWPLSCGNISFKLTWEPEPKEIPARACDCSFCVKHGGVWTSCNTGSVKVNVGNPSLVSKYSFGTKTAQFHICSRCGVVPVVTSLIDGHTYAVVSVNAFEGVDPSLLRRSSASFEGENEGDRLSRRKKNWIANVEYIAGDA
jgi:hypothetical protein